MFRLLTSFCRSGNLGEVSVENDPQQEHFIYEEGKENENFEAVRGYFWRLLDQPGDRALSAIFVSGKRDRDGSFTDLSADRIFKDRACKADFLLSNMAFFFVPAGVSIINYFDELKSTAVQLIIICIISTVVTFAVTAYSVMLTVRLMKKWKDRRKKA